MLAFFFVQRMPRQLQMSYERLGRVDNDLAMMKPRLTGADAKGNPYVITADMAVQDAHDPKKASLKNMEADLALDKQRWLNARAKTGMVDMNTGQLELTGGIDVFTDTGYELHSHSASANLKQSVIHGHEPVTGQGPDGTLRADQFHADRTTNILTLSGHVQMTLIRSQEMKTVLALFAAAAFAAPAFAVSAQAAPAPKASKAPITGQHDNNAPINISSDSFQADLNGKSGTYTGNVVVVQGDTKLRANQVQIITVNGKADKITASGNVVVDSPTSGTATGDNGVYSVGPRTVLMTGNVVLKKGKDVMRGTQLTVNLNTGQATLGAGGPKAPGAPGGRVQGVFTPNSN